MPLHSQTLFLTRGESAHTCTERLVESRFQLEVRNIVANENSMP